MISMVSDKRLEQLANDPMMCNISSEVQQCLRELIRSRAAIESICRYLDPDHPTNYRADDPEGAMDTAFGIARKVITDNCKTLEDK